MIDDKVDRKAIVNAVKKIKLLHSKWLEEAEKKPLLDDLDDTSLFLQITLKKIPSNSKLETIKIPLPHSFITDNTEICLITGDLDKRDRKAEIEPTVEHYKNLLQKRHVQCISEVIPLRQLRTDYKSFEAKRQLLGAYEIFLADNKIYQCLGRLLGKHFIRKRKFPQGIDMTVTNLKYQIEKSLSTAVLYLSGHGNTCSIKVSRLGLSMTKTVENINALIKGLEEKFPGSWSNINGLYLKTARSKALPIYISFESGNDVFFKSKHMRDKVEAEEITTLKNAKVKVFSDGVIQLVPCKKEERSDTDDDLEEELLAEIKSKKKNSMRKLKWRRKEKLKQSKTK